VVTYDDNTPDYAAMAVRLDRLEKVPTEVLTNVVARNGLCLLDLWPEIEPDWDDCAPSDRALAQRLCEECPVIDQCLELELRTAGANTRGVWGATCDDDRRALHRVWQRRRQRRNGSDQEGGETP
jgi:WhiB family transcriptional regulator, redox-sensing transcriptional regulator